jgi:hypothetical protein
MHWNLSTQTVSNAFRKEGDTKSNLQLNCSKEVSDINSDYHAARVNACNFTIPVQIRILPFEPYRMGFAVFKNVFKGRLHRLISGDL